MNLGGSNYGCPMFVLWEYAWSVCGHILWRIGKGFSIWRSHCLNSLFTIDLSIQWPLQLTAIVTTMTDHHSDHYGWPQQYHQSDHCGWPSRWTLQQTTTVTTKAEHHSYHQSWPPQLPLLLTITVNTTTECLFTVDLIKEGGVLWAWVIGVYRLL